MNYRKHGLKALGLSLLSLLGLMAFAAGGAQASGLLLVEGLSGSFTVGITGKEHNSLTGSLLVLGLNMEIFCHQAPASGLLQESGSGSTTISFDNCLVQGVTGSDVLTGAVCEIPNITATANALVILHA